MTLTARDLPLGSRVDIRFSDETHTFERGESVHETYGGRTDTGAQRWYTSWATVSGQDIDWYIKHGRAIVRSVGDGVAP